MGSYIQVLALLLCDTVCQGVMIRDSVAMCSPMIGTEYTAVSQVICAAITHLKNGIGYNYTYPTCTVFGLQIEARGNSSIFVPRQTPTGDDIAYMKPTNSSGVQFSLYPSLAVDGNDFTMYHSLVPNSAGHWWVVDFLGLYTISSVFVLPRPRAYASRFFNIEIRIGQTLPPDGDFSSWHLFHFYAGPYNDTEGRLNLMATDDNCGRFLSIQRIPTNATPSLNIMDVKAFARP